MSMVAKQPQSVKSTEAAPTFGLSDREMKHPHPVVSQLQKPAQSIQPCHQQVDLHEKNK